MIDVEMHMRAHASSNVLLLTALVTIYININETSRIRSISFDKQKHGNDVVVDTIPNFT